MEIASLAQLTAAHRRHDEVIAELIAASRRLAAGRPDNGDLDLVRGAVAYFEQDVPLHFLDEEGSLFPRLSTRRPELAETLASLSAEHPTQIEMHGAVIGAAAQFDSRGRSASPAGAGKALLEAAERLASAHHAHISREEAVVGGAREALTPEDDAEIVAEMVTRRDREKPVVRKPAPKPTTRMTTKRAAKRATTPSPKSKAKTKPRKTAAKKPARKPKAKAKAKGKRR
jgi:hypothetical protein